MRWTKVVLAAALALGAAPATAGSTGGDSAVSQEQRAAWLAQRARLAADIPSAPSYDALDDWGWYADLVDAGDFDGDGKGDFLDVRSHLTYDDTTGFTEEVRLDAYRGFDGKLLWTRSLPPASFVFPTVTKTGVDGKQGVVVVAFTETGTDTPVAGVGGYDTTISSYNGAGLPLWVRPLGGLWADSLAGFGYADHFFEGFLDAVPGGGTDLLVQSVTAAAAYAPTGAVGEERSATQLSLLDGATGAAIPLGKPITDGGWGINPRPMGDVDKDKRDDVLVEAESRAGTTMTGVASSDGRTLWTTKSTGVEQMGFVNLPDVTGDGAADFSTVSWTFGGGIIIVGPGGGAAPTQRDSGPAFKVSLYDGATGRAKWSKPGSRIFPLGDIDRRPGIEVAVGAPVSGGYHGFTVGAFTGSGKRVWSTTRKLPAGDRYPEMNSSWSASSDVHGDGVNDVGYSLVAYAGKKAKRDEGMINGRTGRVTRDPRPGMFLTRAALDGRGADGYLADAARGVLTFDAWRGDSPARLWSLAVRGRGEFSGTTSGSVDGDKCGDVSLSLIDDAFTDVVVSGGTGKPLWTLTRSGGETATVGKASVVRHKVYRKGC